MIDVDRERHSDIESDNERVSDRRKIEIESEQATV